MRSEQHGDLTRCLKPLVAQIGEVMTVWTATTESKQGQEELAHNVLGALGKEICSTDEKYLGMATSLKGSGPANVSLLMEALVDAGVHIGLPGNLAQQLAIQTIIGSTLTVEKTGKHP